MQLQKVKIHNFRSVLDANFELEKYVLLVGENDTGENICKRNPVTAEQEKSKAVALDGFFDPKGKLSVNGIDIELDEYGMFSTGKEFNLTSGKNLLIFEGIHPSGEKETLTCYLYYDPSY